MGDKLSRAPLRLQPFASPVSLVGAIERIAFPKTCGEGRTITEIASMALDVLKNADLRAAIVTESQERALERLSFQAVRSQLADFFATLQGTTAPSRRGL